MLFFLFFKAHESSWELYYLESSSVRELTAQLPCHYGIPFFPSHSVHTFSSSFSGKRCDPLGKEQIMHSPATVLPGQTLCHCQRCCELTVWFAIFMTISVSITRTNCCFLILCGSSRHLCSCHPVSSRTVIAPVFTACFHPYSKCFCQINTVSLSSPTLSPDKQTKLFSSNPSALMCYSVLRIGVCQSVLIRASYYG